MSQHSWPNTQPYSTEVPSPLWRQRQIANFNIMPITWWKSCISSSSFQLVLTFELSTLSGNNQGNSVTTLKADSSKLYRDKTNQTSHNKQQRRTNIHSASHSPPVPHPPIYLRDGLSGKVEHLCDCDLPGLDGGRPDSGGDSGGNTIALLCWAGAPYRYCWCHQRAQPAARGRLRPRLGLTDILHEVWKR